MIPVFFYCIWFGHIFVCDRETPCNLVLAELNFAPVQQHKGVESMRPANRNLCLSKPVIYSPRVFTDCPVVSVVGTYFSCKHHCVFFLSPLLSNFFSLWANCLKVMHKLWKRLKQPNWQWLLAKMLTSVDTSVVNGYIVGNVLLWKLFIFFYVFVACSTPEHRTLVRVFFKACESQSARM